MCCPNQSLLPHTLPHPPIAWGNGLSCHWGTHGLCSSRSQGHLLPVLSWPLTGCLSSNVTQMYLADCRQLRSTVTQASISPLTRCPVEREHMHIYLRDVQDIIYICFLKSLTTLEAFPQRLTSYPEPACSQSLLLRRRQITN